MNWLNLRTEILHSPEFIGCDPTRRATWLSLMLWCAQQENSGTVTGARSWSDRRWQQTCGVTAAEVAESCDLFTWRGDDLVMWGYDVDKQAEVQERREVGRISALKRWRSRSVNGSPIGSPNGQPNTEGEVERERNENENKNEKKAIQAAPIAAATDALALTSELPTKPKRAKKQPAQTDAEWIASLAASPAYAGMDVAREHAKASEWCRVRQQTLGRQRFVNWLNRADKPLNASTNANSRRSFEQRNDYSKTGI